MKRLDPLPFNKSVDKAITRGLRKSGEFLQRKTVQTLTTGRRTGRIYIIRGKRHQASAAGEPPAKLSGRLARSVGHNVANKQLTVGEGEFYAKFLEEGTSRMAARPHLLATFNKNQSAVTRLIGKEVLQVLT